MSPQASKVHLLKLCLRRCGVFSSAIVLCLAGSPGVPALSATEPFLRFDATILSTLMFCTEKSSVYFLFMCCESG